MSATVLSIALRAQQHRFPDADPGQTAGQVHLAMRDGTVDVLIIDDFALEPMTREESRDLYQLFVERNARLSTIVTSNRDTAEWIATFDDALLAQSAVDRFKNNAFDLVIDGESYRSRLKPNIENLGPPPSAPVRKPPANPRRKVNSKRR